METSEENSILAEAALIEILNNNKKILDTKITDQTIEQYVKLCAQQDRHERYIQILTALCSCNQEAVISNQNAICEHLLENDEIREYLLVPIISENNNTFIFLAEYSNQVLLWEFKHISQQSDDARLFNYFLSLMELVAELAFQNNHKASRLKNVYKFNVIFQAIQDERIVHSIRSRFIRMILNMYVDQAELEQIVVPNLTFVWSNITQQDVNQITIGSAEITPEIQELQNFIYKYLKDLDGVQRAYCMDQNQMTMEIIQLLRFLILHGFYKTQRDIEQILIPIIDLLDGSCDIINPEEEIQEADEDNSLTNKKIKSLFSIEPEVKKKSNKQRKKRTGRYE